jgi:hypothetical protein
VGVNSSVIYLIYCKDLCKCHNVLLPSTKIKLNSEQEKKIYINLNLGENYGARVGVPWNRRKL